MKPTEKFVPIYMLVKNIKMWAFLVFLYSQDSDISNFIESDQKVAPYQLVVSWVMTPKNDFLLIGAGTIIPKGFMNTANFGKTSLFIEQNCE